MADPFHEPRVISEALTREFTSVGSLNTATAFNAVVACEGTIGALVKEATGRNFPYQSYPRHKPGQWITELGVSSYYSPETLKFLNKVDGYCLDKARYENESAFQQYISANDRSRVLADGVPRLIAETEELVAKPEVGAQLQAVAKSWK